MATRYTSPSRRTFLKLLGQAGTASVFAPALRQSFGQSSQAPLRFLAVMSEHGKIAELWDPKGTGTTFDISFPNATLAPLIPFKDRMAVIGGLDYRVLYDQGATGHGGGPATVFTGSKYLGADGATRGGRCESPSLDMFLGDQLGTVTPFRSIQLVNAAGYCDGQVTAMRIAYQSTGQLAPIILKPLDAYNRLFANFTPGGADGGTMMGNDALAKARRQSLVDYWKADATRLRSKLGPTEQQKLDQHLEGLRDIERRIATMSTTPAAGAASCGLPVKPRAYSSTELTGAGCGSSVGENLIPEKTTLMMDILAHGFACSRTHFGSLVMFLGDNGEFGDFKNLVPTGQLLHDNLVHAWKASSTNTLAVNSYLTWVATQLAYLCTKLQSFGEGEGTVLDHSLIAWGNELSDPAAHNQVDMPFVLLGGAGGKLKMGQALKYAGVPHNRLLTTIAKTFVPSVTTFGNAAYPGDLPELVA